MSHSGDPDVSCRNHPSTVSAIHKGSPAKLATTGPPVTSLHSNAGALQPSFSFRPLYKVSQSWRMQTVGLEAMSKFRKWLRLKRGQEPIKPQGQPPRFSPRQVPPGRSVQNLAPGRRSRHSPKIRDAQTALQNFDDPP